MSAACRPCWPTCLYAGWEGTEITSQTPAWTVNPSLSRLPLGMAVISQQSCVIGKQPRKERWGLSLPSWL